MLSVQTEDRMKQLKMCINSPGAATGETVSGSLISILKKKRDMWMWIGFDMIIRSEAGKSKESRIKPKKSLFCAIVAAGF
jgi:hypothetical protein